MTKDTTNQYGQPITSTGHVLTASEVVAEELRDIVAEAKFNGDPGIDGLLGANMDSEYFEALLKTLAGFVTEKLHVTAMEQHKAGLIAGRKEATAIIESAKAMQKRKDTV